MSSFSAALSRTKVTKDARKKNRILIADIERIQGVVEHKFWDLGDMKNRRFRPDEIVRYPRTICWSAAWYDQPKKVMHGAEWEIGGAEAMLRAIWDLYDEADIVVGHNLARFDSKHLKGAWLEMGLPSPRPWQTVDTLSIARREFGFESNTLDALCKRLGVASKTDAYDPKVAEAAVAGDEDAQRRLLDYNVGDIHATRELYDRLRPYIKGHPHLGLGTGDERACPNCGGTKFTKIDTDVRTIQTKYAAMRCSNCQAVVRNSHMRERMTTRAAR